MLFFFQQYIPVFASPSTPKEHREVANLLFANIETIYEFHKWYGDISINIITCLVFDVVRSLYLCLAGVRLQITYCCHCSDNALISQPRLRCLEIAPKSLHLEPPNSVHCKLQIKVIIFGRWLLFAGLLYKQCDGKEFETSGRNLEAAVISGSTVIAVSLKCFSLEYQMYIIFDRKCERS